MIDWLGFQRVYNCSNITANVDRSSDPTDKSPHFNRNITNSTYTFDFNVFCKKNSSSTIINNFFYIYKNGYRILRKLRYCWKSAIVSDKYVIFATDKRIQCFFWMNISFIDEASSRKESGFQGLTSSSQTMSLDTIIT